MNAINPTNIQRSVTLHYCSACAYTSEFANRVQRHTNSSKSVCKHARILSKVIDVDFPCFPCDEHIQKPRSKPGPVPINAENVLAGRAPAFSDDGIDARFEYLFETPGLLDTILGENMKVSTKLSKLFRHLWGPDAPEKFQSIGVCKNKVYEILEFENTHCCNEYKSVRNYMYEGAFLTNFIECIESLCSVSIPLHRPDLVARVDHILGWISRPYRGLTMMDVFDKTEAYERKRKGASAVIKRAKEIYEVLKDAIAGVPLKPQRETQNGTQKKRVGRTPLDIDSVLQGRVSAFEDDDIDARFEYIFETDGLLDTCINLTRYMPVPDKLAALFHHVWGQGAPQEFQSIVMHNGKVYEVEGNDINDTVLFNEFKSIHTYMHDGAFLKNFMECVDSLCSVSIPLRRPDLVACADGIIEWISSSSGGITMMDVFDKTQTYMRNKKNATDMTCKAKDTYASLKTAISDTMLRSTESLRRPLDIDAVLQGRVSAFDDGDIDARFEYLFATDGLLDKCINKSGFTTVPTKIVYLFRHAWGADAPEQFQSIVMHKGKVYEIEGNDINGAVLFNEFKSVREYMYGGDFLTNFIESLKALCAVSIPARRPDLTPYADHILDWISSPMDGLTVMDVFEKTEAYEKKRKHASSVVKRANAIYSGLNKNIHLTRLNTKSSSS